ncbi:MAG TPA: hypothetical protein VFP15_06130 [Gemmatimonadaceae bacterium]|nr:hypothetical protein [Gemmatimonadaceae bacterium]
MSRDLRLGRFIVRLAVAALLLPALGACRDTMAAFGGAGRGRAAAEQAFEAIADRHFDVLRNARYEYARVHLTKGALSPSRVFDDSAAWTAMTGNVRLLEVFGTVGDGHYVLNARSSVPAPARPGDGRHATTLVRLSENEYRWETTVDYAIGSVRPADVVSVISHLLAAGEGRTERELRADLAATAPRTAAALGSVFTLDTLRPTALADGSTAVTVGISVSSAGLKRRLPAFAEFIRKYVEPTTYHAVVADRAGVPFVDVMQRDRYITIRLRTSGGRLVPLSGPARPIPDTLLFVADFKTKVKIFHVGFHDLVMEFVNQSNGDRDHFWSVTAHREPKWDLPLVTARLLRAPLRRPFAGEGALFRIGVRAGDNGGPTVIVRQSHLTVQESGILNFLNALGNTAMDDFDGAVEREENAWLRELFLALRDDARAALQ